MWQEFLNLFRKPEETVSEPTPAESVTPGSTDFQIRSIRTDTLGVYEFQADLYHVPTSTRISVIRGDSEKALRREAKEKADAFLYRQSMIGRSLDL